MVMEIIITISNKMDDSMVETMEKFINESNLFVLYHCEYDFQWILFVLNAVAAWGVIVTCFTCFDEYFNFVNGYSLIIAKKAYQLKFKQVQIDSTVGRKNSIEYLIVKQTYSYSHQF